MSTDKTKQKYQETHLQLRAETLTINCSAVSLQATQCKKINYTLRNKKSQHLPEWWGMFKQISSQCPQHMSLLLWSSCPPPFPHPIPFIEADDQFINM